MTRIAPEGNLHIDYLAIVATLLITQLLPLALGLGIHQQRPGWPVGSPNRSACLRMSCSSLWS